MMPTIDGALRAAARRLPGSEALSFRERDYTYAELDAAVDLVAAALAGLGLTKGDRFALMATNSDRFVIAFYAAMRLGAVFVPVNPASAPPEIGYLLRDSGASVFVVEPSLVPVVQTATQTGLPDTLERILSLGPSDAFDDLLALAAAAGQAPEVEVTEADDSMILYTSGTTGQPKGAVFDHHRSIWVAMNCIAACGMKVGDRFLHVAPLYHGAELCIMLISGTLLGVKHVVLAGFDPAVVVDTMESERITMFFGVPTMYLFLLRQPGLADRDLSAWRTGLFGAAPMPASGVEQLIAALPNVEFMQLCGQTEGGPGGLYLTGEQVRARPDASGRQTLPLTQARVVDLDDNDVKPGDVGEIILRGETVMKGYWNKPEETAETLRGGWLRTGDLALLDEDGYLTLVDRIKDMIITGGRNVYSVEVESALAAHPDILDSAVVARPHAEYGESIVAVVTLHEGKTMTLEDLRAFCRDRIASYKLPHELVLREIPRNPSGKIQKHKIRESLGI
jgi:fatty-acyl-CoA synthase